MKSKRQKTNHNRTILLILAGFFSVFALVGVLLGVRFFRFYDAIQTPSNPSKPSEVKKDKTAFTYLLLGYGGGKHEGTYLTDSIMLVHFNTESKRAVLISIPRDLWVRVPTQNDSVFRSKINAVYQMGLFPKQYPALDASLVADDPAGFLKKVVQDVTGLPVDGYVTIDFEGFTKVIDTLGGIEVDVPRSFTDYEYPIEENMNDLCERDEEFAKIEPIINKEFSPEQTETLFREHPELETFYKDIKDRPVLAFPCRYETISFSAGKTSMDGETALKYARSRHALGDGGDFNRARRQQTVIQGVKNKMLSIGFIPKIIPLLNELEKHIRTDIPLSTINTFVKMSTGINDYVIEQLVISDAYVRDDFSPVGGSILVPREGGDSWKAVQEEIRLLRLGITPSPTPAHASPSAKLTPSD